MDEFILWLEQNSTSCVYKTMFGYECPGCGGQRSFVLLLRGEFAESFAMYPALIPFLCLAIFVLAAIAFKIPKAMQVIKYGFLSVMGLIFLSYFYKMITVGV